MFSGLSFKLRPEEINAFRAMEEASLAQSSLHEFVKQAWPEIEGGDEFVDGWHIGAICEHLEAVVKGQIKNLLVNVPPRTSKSTIISVMFPAWVWITYPHKKFLCASYGQKLATRDSARCRRLIMSPWYRERWGHIYQLAKDQNEKLRFENTKLGFRIATSVGGVALGEGGDILVADDPNAREESQSETKRQTTLDWWDQTWSTRLNDRRTGAKILVQQRLHESDVSGHTMSKDTAHEVVKLILPMEYESERKCKTIILPSTNGKIWEDPRKDDGELLWPNKIGHKELESLKSDLGSSYSISGQLQQRPTPTGGGLIKKDWFTWWKKSNPPKMIRRIQSLDTAYGEGEEGCYSAITTWGYFNDENDVPSLMLLNLWRGKLEYPFLRELCQNVFEDYRNDGSQEVTPDGHHSVDMMLVEAKANGVSLVQDLRRAGIHAVKFDPSKHGDKTQRVILSTPIIENGLIYVPALPPDYRKLRRISNELLDHCALFPAADSRDIVDTMSQIILYMQTQGLLSHKKNPKALSSITRPQHGFYNTDEHHL